MEILRVVKIGDELGVFFPETWPIHEGMVIPYDWNENSLVLDFAEAYRNEDCKLIEASFAEFETDEVLTEAQMKEKFCAYGWGQ